MLAPGAIADPGLQNYYQGISWILFKASNYYYAAVFVLACLGALFMALRRRGYNKAAVVLLILYVLYFSAMYAATTAMDRYNFNVLPVFAIFGAYGIMCIYHFIHKTISQKVDRSNQPGPESR